MGRVGNISSDLHRPSAGSGVRASRVSKEKPANKRKGSAARTKAARKLVALPKVAAEEPLVITEFPSVWEAIGYSPEEAMGLNLRAGLMSDIRQIVRANKWSQATAAKRCGVSQPRINDLLRGKFHKFSLDALVKMAACLGNKVTIQMKAA